ncbi:hypothetical protein [Aureliella helgolandensis]|uniref:Uncharacterized protein n=1 Tax=Aureliella helgolandensis TaxID=2527968 RepID=A0A518G4B8_9BACT|nr:hypothetical protein [Aureliella helgolandensis]QDV23425.1 hypothetical protein Q31a_17230 [Aureliella helgolandensis]
MSTLLSNKDAARVGRVVRAYEAEVKTRASRRPPPIPDEGSGDNHYLYTLTAAMSSGSGTATIRNMADDEEIETGAIVVDTLGMFDGLAIGQRGICIKSGEAYYSIGPYVTRVRWADPDLEYTKDGTNWTNIDTAEDCS